MELVSVDKNWSLQKGDDIMYAIVNFEKFINDHSELHDQRDTILAKVREAAGGLKVVGGAIPDEVFSQRMATLFHHEVTSNPEHIRIGLEAFEAEPLT